MILTKPLVINLSSYEKNLTIFRVFFLKPLTLIMTYNCDDPICHSFKYDNACTAESWDLKLDNSVAGLLAIYLPWQLWQLLCIVQSRRSWHVWLSFSLRQNEFCGITETMPLWGCIIKQFFPIEPSKESIKLFCP